LWLKYIEGLRDTISNLEEIIEANEEGWERERGVGGEVLREVRLEKDELGILVGVYAKEIAENCGIGERLQEVEKANAGLRGKILELEGEKLQIQNETIALIGMEFGFGLVKVFLLEKVKADNAYGDTMIDKKFIGSFLVNYFDFEEDLGKKLQVLETMSSILDFDDEQKAKIGLRTKDMKEVVDARNQHE
jgi:hypothetical protein